MAQARGSAIVAIVLFMSMALHYEIAHATNYTVGDGAGWSFKVQEWPNGKHFQANDTLEFKYDNGRHNVAVVDEIGYTTCTVGHQVFSSGHDKIQLKKGQNYFICGFLGHCALGMKIAVNAA